MPGYNMTLDGVNYELKLTAKAQQNLESKYKDGAMAVILNAVDRISVRSDVFQQALNFKGSANPVKDGYEFCDLLVENGFAGQEDFTEILLGVAKASGIVNDKTKEKLSRRVAAYMNNLFEEGTSEGPEEENPTKIAAESR